MREHLVERLNTSRNETIGNYSILDRLYNYNLHNSIFHSHDAH